MDPNELRVLYQPVQSRAMAGRKWGARAGVVLKLSDTLIVLDSVDAMLIVLDSVDAMLKVSEVNFLFMALAVALAGAIGALLGMAIGGILGLCRKSSLPRAQDALLEPNEILVRAVLFQLVAGCALIVFYIFVFNPWLVTVLE